MDESTAESLLQIAEEARTTMRGSDGAAAVRRVEEQYPAMRSTLDWCLARGRADLADRLASALVPFWIATSRIDDGDGWFARTLASADGDPRRARALYDHGYLVFWAGRYELAEERFSQARDLAEEAKDPTVVALALAGSARVALNDDGERAVRLLREALAFTEGTTDREGRSSVMHVLGVALQMSGDLAAAREVMSERIRIGRESGDEFLVWVESANLSMVELKLGNVERAEVLSRDALSIISSRGDQMAIPWGINGLAAVIVAKGDHPRAATLIGFAEALLERAGGEWPPDEREQYEGTVRLLAEALSPQALQNARATGAAMSVSEGLAYAHGDPSRGAAVD